MSTDLHLTPSEILLNLGIVGKSGVAAVVAYSALDLDTVQARRWYNQFAAPNPPALEDRYLDAVMGYLIYDAACGKATDVADAIDRTMRLAERMPERFTLTAAAERANERAKNRAERDAERTVKLEAAKAEAIANPPDPNAPLVIKRGRKPAGVESIYSRVEKLWNAATDHSKEGFIAQLQEALGLGFGTAQTYFYKAKKEIGEKVLTA